MEHLPLYIDSGDRNVYDSCHQSYEGWSEAQVAYIVNATNNHANLLEVLEAVRDSASLDPREDFGLLEWIDTTIAKAKETSA